MEILRKHHLAVIYSDYARSRAFYVGLLGFKIVSEIFRQDRNSNKLNFSMPGGGEIELFSFSNPPIRPSYPEACGLRHLAFEVVDVGEASRFLEKHGVKVEPIRIDELTNRKFAFFADPDGLPIKLYEN